MPRSDSRHFRSKQLNYPLLSPRFIRDEKCSRQIFSLWDIVGIAMHVRREDRGPTVIRGGITVIEHLARCELSCA